MLAACIHKYLLLFCFIFWHSNFRNVLILLIKIFKLKRFVYPTSYSKDLSNYFRNKQKIYSLQRFAVFFDFPQIIVQHGGIWRSCKNCLNDLRGRVVHSAPGPWCLLWIFFHLILLIDSLSTSIKRIWLYFSWFQSELRNFNL